MKALLFKGPHKMESADVPVPRLENGDALLKVGAALICGTDIRIYRGKKTKDVRIPSVLGHEFAGVIAETKGPVPGFKTGDAVSLAPVLPCLTCYNCRHGQENVCANRTAFGYEFDGGFAEYVRIPAAAFRSGNIYHAPDRIPFEEIALAEPLACCINGQRKSPVKLGDVAVIMGAGPIGLMHLALAKSSGARVIVSEPGSFRREMALAFGADAAVDPAGGALQAAVMEFSGGVGADAVILAIGVPALVNTAIELARKGGTVNLFAGFSAGDMPPVDVNLIHYKEVKETGTSASSRKDHELALKLIAGKTMDATKLISHRFSLEQAEEAFKLADAGAGIKVAVMP